jgi:hemerythrin-like metal-binding protein
VSDWEEGMTVGVESLDAHHRQVLRRIRHLARAVSEGDAADLRASLRFLHTYLAEHQRDEEQWMEDAGYPGAREHLRSHGAILERIAAARSDATAGSDRRLLEAADWVARALEGHMRGDDLKLGRFWTARENLRRLAEAGPGVGASLTPIPGMLPVDPPRPRRDDGPAKTPAPLPPAER